MTVLVRPYRVKGGTNDVSLDVYPKMRKKVVLSPPHLFFDYKNVDFFVLRAEPSQQADCLSQAYYANKLTLCLSLAEFFLH